MKWKVLLKNGRFVTGERELIRDGFELVGFWLLNISDSNCDIDESHILFIPWGAVLHIEEIP